MLVNGKNITIDNKLYLQKFLEQEGYIIDRVAVEKNGTIVPKDNFVSEILLDSDHLEIVNFVGGG
ncbi:MAG: sulfur carrier protein ThiS [Marinilabiliaceae bacterium]|nr:sulfur carrier protein ThiS [Marinilabiliaceae bacterium]